MCSATRQLVRIRDSPPALRLPPPLTARNSARGPDRKATSRLLWALRQMSWFLNHRSSVGQVATRLCNLSTSRMPWLRGVERMEATQALSSAISNSTKDSSQQNRATWSPALSTSRVRMISPLLHTSQGFSHAWQTRWARSSERHRSQLLFKSSDKEQLSQRKWWWHRVSSDNRRSLTQQM